jgi:hypothetical protein
MEEGDGYVERRLQGADRVLINRRKKEQKEAVLNMERNQY